MRWQKHAAVCLCCESKFLRDVEISQIILVDIVVAVFQRYTCIQVVFVHPMKFQITCSMIFTVIAKGAGNPKGSNFVAIEESIQRRVIFLP